MKGKSTLYNFFYFSFLKVHFQIAHIHAYIGDEFSYNAKRHGLTINE